MAKRPFADERLRSLGNTASGRGVWLKSGLTPKTGSLSASQPVGRQPAGKARGEEKDSGGSDEEMR